MKILKAKITKTLYGYKVFTYLENTTSKKLGFGEVNKKRDYILESVHRAKRQCIDYGINNFWDYFITVTFDIKKIDRYNYELCLEKVLQFFMHYKERSNPDFKYILVPELHDIHKGEEKAAIHFHGLVRGLCPEDLRHFKKFDKKTKKLVDVVDFIPCTARFGTTDLYTISQNTEHITYYICKYICKSGRLLKKSYYCSNGLNTSVLVLTSDTCENLIPNLNNLIMNGYTSTYENDFCTIYDINESLLPYLEKNVSIGEEIPDYVLTDVNGVLEGECIVKNQEKF